MSTPITTWPAFFRNLLTVCLPYPLVQHAEVSSIRGSPSAGSSDGQWKAKYEMLAADLATKDRLISELKGSKGDYSSSEELSIRDAMLQEQRQAIRNLADYAAKVGL